MKNLLIGLCLLMSSGFAFAGSTTTQENANLALIKEMFSQYAEKLDNSKIEFYFSKDFQLVENNEKEKFEAFKKEQETIFNSLKSLKILSYEDVIAKDDKVVGRVSMKLNAKNGRSKTYYVMFVATIKDNKIEKVWQLVYPNWDEKFLTSTDKA